MNKSIFTDACIEVSIPIEKSTVKLLGTMGCDELVSAYKDALFNCDDSGEIICYAKVFVSLVFDMETTISFSVATWHQGIGEIETPVEFEVPELAAQFMTAKTFEYLAETFSTKSETVRITA